MITVATQLLGHVWLCDPLDCSTPGLSVLQYLLERVSDANQPSHPLLPPFPLALKSFPASGSFPVSQLLVSWGQNIGTSVLVPVLPMNVWGWFPLGLTGFTSLLSKGLSRVFSSTAVYLVPKNWSPTCVPASISGLLCYPLIYFLSFDLYISLTPLGFCLYFICLLEDFPLTPLSEIIIMRSN